MNRAVRPAILAVLLAGMVLTLVMAPSTLEAQQTPPGERPTGYGEREGPTSDEIALRPLAGDAGDPTWWIVSAIAVLVVGGGAAVLYLRRRA